jgi:hypothetical protein
MAVEITLGSGQPNAKTRHYRGAKPLAHYSNFIYLDNVALTPAFCRPLIEGALSAKTNREAQMRIMEAEFPSRERAQIAEAVRELPNEGLNSLCIYVRPCEPWETMGTGLGAGKLAFRDSKNPDSFVGSIINSIKYALASQFDELGNVAEFKRIKGVTGDFGILLMPVFASFYPNEADPRKIFAPSVSVNYMGKAYGNALMQCSRGFFPGAFVGNSDVAHARAKSFAKLNRDMSGHTFIYGKSAIKPHLYEFGCDEFDTEYVERNRFFPLDGLDKRVSKILDAGGCYLEAVRKDHYPSEKPQWALTQYYPMNLRPIPPPQVDESSIFPLISASVGMAVAETDKVHLIDTSDVQASIGFNRHNKGYLMLCNLGWLDYLKRLPLSAFSNAGAIVLGYEQMANAMLSHLSGYLRELGIPILITPEPGKFEELLKHGKYTVYANDFSDGDFIARR